MEQAIPRSSKDVISRFLCLQDYTLLVELCSQIFIFGGSLLGIAFNPEVQILRVKNRLDRAYDLAGYHNVGLSLHLVGQEPWSLGIHVHVCEIQLILRPFAELKVCAAD